MNHGKKEFEINLWDSPYDLEKLLDFADRTLLILSFPHFFFLIGF